MAKEAIKIQKGSVVDYTATGTIENGDVIALSSRIGITLDNAVDGEIISLDLEGVYEIIADTDDAISFGDQVYFDSTERNITTTATDNTLAGFAVSEKAADVAGTILVKIG